MRKGIIKVRNLILALTVAVVLPSTVYGAYQEEPNTLFDTGLYSRLSLSGGISAFITDIEVFEADNNPKNTYSGYFLDGSFAVINYDYNIDFGLFVQYFSKSASGIDSTSDTASSSDNSDAIKTILSYAPYVGVSKDFNDGLFNGGVKLGFAQTQVDGEIPNGDNTCELSNKFGGYTLILSGDARVTKNVLLTLGYDYTAGSYKSTVLSGSCDESAVPKASDALGMHNFLAGVKLAYDF